MPIIKEYVQQYSAGAGGDFTGRRATEADFGATNSGLYELGTGVIKAADMLQSYEENKEVADAQQKVALSQADWAENMQQRTLSAKPGERIAPVLQEEMTDYYSKMAGNYRTKKAQDYVKFHGATTTKTAFRSALDFDVRLSVEDSMAKYATRIEAHKKVVQASPDQYGALKSQLVQEVDERLGQFASIPKGGMYDVKLREKLDKDLADLAWHAGQGASPIEKQMILQKVAPTGPIADLTGSQQTVEAINQAKAAFTTEQQTLVEKEIARMHKANRPASEIVAYASSKMPWIEINIDGVTYAPPKEQGTKLSSKISDAPKDQLPDWYNDMSSDRQLQYVNQLESEMKGEMATKRAELVNTLQDHKAQMSVYGNVPNPLSKGDFIAAFGVKAGEEAHRNYEADRVAAADARKFATSSIPEIQKFIKVAEPGPNATKEDFDRFKRTTDFLTKAVEQRQKDGMGFELQSNQNVKPLTALEPNGDVLKFGNELAARIPSADVVSGKNGIPSVISNQEGAMLHNAFRGSTLENKTKILHYTAMALRNNPTYFGQVIQKMIPDQPAAAYAAKIQFASKPATIGGREVWPEEVSRTILTGADYMGQFQESKAAKSDGSGSMAKGVMPDDSKMMKVFAEQMGTALRFHGPIVQEAYEAVKMHYAGSHIAAGNISGELDQEAFKRSIRTVIGPAVQAGTSQVIPPWGMDESAFKDEWKGRLMQQGINPEHVYTAKEVSRNAYIVTLGGETGRQYVIDFNKEFKKEDKPMLNPTVTQGAVQKATKTFESAKAGLENLTSQFFESGFVIGQ